MPHVRLDAADAAEPAEMLQFLSGWLARDPARLAASLQECTGHPAYRRTQLRHNLERLVFLARRQRRRTPIRPGAITPGGSTTVLWPQPDTAPGRIRDQLRLEAGLRLGDARGGPFADEGHRPGRWQPPPAGGRVWRNRASSQNSNPA